MTSHPLDDPAWPALTSRHEHLAEIAGPARRYQRGTSFFAGTDIHDDAAWEGLAALAGPGGSVVLARAVQPEPPAGWTQGAEILADQLVAEVLVDLRVPADVEVRELGPNDVPAMLELTALTRPGPFFRRTAELGRYVGVVESGRLLAMAGQRLCLPGYTEVSAVCTHPDARRRGLGAVVTHAVAGDVLAAGDTPFLHVADGNHDARRLYEALGFRPRTRIRFTTFTAPVAGGHIGTAGGGR